MGGAKFVVAGVLAVSALLRATVAFAGDDDATKLCASISDAAASYIRAGRLDRARVLKPFLERCDPILKAALDHEVKIMIDRLTEPTAAPR